MASESDFSAEHRENTTSSQPFPNEPVDGQFDDFEFPEDWVIKDLYNRAELAAAIGFTSTKKHIDSLREEFPEDFSSVASILHFTRRIAGLAIGRSREETEAANINSQNESQNEKSSQRQNHTGESEETRINKNFEHFKRSLLDSESEDAQKLNRLIGIFGSESTVDIIYRWKPEFKGKIPTPIVRSFLADYLGECAIAPGKLDFDNLAEAADYLDNEDLQKALVGVMKRHCLRTYHQKKRRDPNVDDFNEIADSIEEIREKISSLESPAFDGVVKQVEHYFISVFSVESPSHVVNSLKEGRPFPDLNQRINVWEAKEQKRLLIADDPGMGKSASAILTKELVGAKCAVIITPSSVVDEGVWQIYLSSKIEEGQQVGYFKEGFEPRVLVLDSQNAQQPINTEDWDYILVSKEKLNPSYRYSDILKGLDFDMLIIDEAHQFKNIIDGARAHELLQLAEKMKGSDKYLMMLTATPAPNKVADIALSLRLLYPDRFKDLTNPQLVSHIIKGDLLEIRSLLVNRMQNKKMADLIDVPPMIEDEVELELSDEERTVYEDVILEGWELFHSEKIRFLRLATLNPAVLDAVPEIPKTKIDKVGEDLQQLFESREKVVLFVNDCIKGIMYGPDNIISSFNLPDDIHTYRIYADTTKAERRQIMDSFQNDTTGKTLLVISGQTVSVGVDLSRADAVLHFNEPWTMTEKIQQIGRSQRPGRHGRLLARTYRVKGTIEEGIYRYTQMKHRAIEKLIYGIPITEVEQTLVAKGEESDESAFAGDHELASYYFSSIKRMNLLFGKVREMGEARFRELLEEYGDEYAGTYRQMISRSYAANASRLASTVVTRLMEDEDHPIEPTIYDLGSGPEMLRRHMPENTKAKIVSVDLNPRHFEDAIGETVVASMSDTKAKDRSVDFVTMSLAYHYTRWLPSKGENDRLAALTEINRILKPGGKAVIIMPHSVSLKDMVAFKDGIRQLGFRAIDDYTGEVKSGENFKAQIVTLEKIDESGNNLRHLIRTGGELLKMALRMKKRDDSMHDSRRIVTDYTLNDSNIHAVMNQRDLKVLEEEQEILKTMQQLRSEFKGIRNIPKEVIESCGFARVFDGKDYVLFRSLSTGDGAVVLRNL